MPNKTHGRFDCEWIFFLKNLLLRTSPRFFTRSEPNQCRKILWTVNINNYQKKIELLTRCRNGVPKHLKRAGALLVKCLELLNRMRYLRQTQNTYVRAQSEVTGKNRGARPLGGAIRGKNIKMAIMATICPWKSVCTVLVESATSFYKDICVSQKTWPHCPTNLSTCKTRLTEADRNETWWACLAYGPKSLREIWHKSATGGRYRIFQGRKRLFVARFYAHAQNIRIIR